MRYVRIIVSVFTALLLTYSMVTSTDLPNGILSVIIMLIVSTVNSIKFSKQKDDLLFIDRLLVNMLTVSIILLTFPSNIRDLLHISKMLLFTPLIALSIVHTCIEKFVEFRFNRRLEIRPPYTVRKEFITLIIILNVTNMIAKQILYM